MQLRAWDQSKLWFWLVESMPFSCDECSYIIEFDRCLLGAYNAIGEKWASLGELPTKEASKGLFLHRNFQ